VLSLHLQFTEVVECEDRVYSGLRWRFDSLDLDDSQHGDSLAEWRILGDNLVLALQLFAESYDRLEVLAL
jgi:hypothetical protein